MCTLALAFKTDRRWPLLVAANRDERLARPSEGWLLRNPPRGPRLIAPRDLVQGGTWAGLSEKGLFAAVTNVHQSAPPDPSRRSRGELVGLALENARLAGARAFCRGAPAQDYNPFNLLVASAEEAFLTATTGRAWNSWTSSPASIS